MIGSIQLRMREGFGTTKKKNQQTSVTDRLATANQSCDCPVFIDEFNTALEHMPDVSKLTKWIKMYPVLFEEQCFKNRSATATSLKINEKQYRFNFNVPSSVL